MNDNPKGKDGFSRVYAKMKLGAKKWWKATKTWRDEYKAEPTNSHHFVDIFVEGERIDDREVEYFLGHVLCYLVVLTPVLLGTIGLLLVTR